MRNWLNKLLICLIVLFNVNTAYAFDVTIENDTDCTLIFLLYRVDHAFRDEHPGPLNIMGGELDGYVSMDSIEKRSPGIYLVEWYSRLKNCESMNKNRFNFRVGKWIKKITIKTDKLEAEM